MQSKTDMIRELRQISKDIEQCEKNCKSHRKFKDCSSKRDEGCCEQNCRLKKTP